MTNLEKWREFLSQWSNEKPITGDVSRYTLRNVSLDWYETVNICSGEPMIMITAASGLSDLIVNFDSDGNFEQAGR